MLASDMAIRKACQKAEIGNQRSQATIGRPCERNDEQRLAQLKNIRKVRHILLSYEIAIRRLGHGLKEASCDGRKYIVALYPTQARWRCLYDGPKGKLSIIPIERT
jgi:hypothetical protein